MGSPFIGCDAPASFLGVTDEYDPLKPNDYEKFIKLRREEKQREREERRSQPEDRGVDG